MATRSAKIDQKADLIWAIADKLTGVYKPHEYGDVILPLTVIRRFDCILSDTSVAEDYMLRSGDIIFVRSNGSKELVGRAVMVNNIEYPVTYSGFCIRFRNIRPDIIDSKFLLYYFRSFDFRKQLEKYSQGSNISNLNQELLSSLQFTIPSMDYQKNVLDAMQEKCKEIDNAIAKFEGINNKLQEYKKSLIYEVVTGKKEV